MLFTLPSAPPAARVSPRLGDGADTDEPERFRGFAAPGLVAVIRWRSAGAQTSTALWC